MSDLQVANQTRTERILGGHEKAQGKAIGLSQDHTGRNKEKTMT